MAKTKELKKRYGAEVGSITSVLERAVSRERLFLFSAFWKERLIQLQILDLETT